MNNLSQKLWQRLKNAKLVHGEMPELVQVDSPWYIKFLLGLAGWWAAAFGLSFLMLVFTIFMENTTAVFILGSLLIGGAFFILRHPDQTFLEHLGLAISLTGQVLVMLVIFSAVASFGAAGFDSEFNWVLAGLFQVVLVFVVPNFVHRVFCTWNAAILFAVALFLFELPYIFSSAVMLLMVWCWLHEYTYAKHIEKIRALAYGLTLALVTIESFVLFVSKGEISNWGANFTRESMMQPWMGEALLGCVALYMVWSLFRQNKQSMQQPLVIVSLLATLLVVAASFEATGLTVGMVIVLLGFMGSNRVLMGIGIVSLLFYVSAYYYLLETTLLQKSLTLLGVGTLLLGLRWLMLHFVSQGAVNAR
jgi:uncharacterized membrane protein